MNAEPKTRPTLTRLPVAWAHEDGDTWWAEGHWTDEAMLLAVIMEQLAVAECGRADLLHLLVATDKPYQDLGSEWDVMAAMERTLNDVGRVWLKPDPANDEHMLRANEGEDGAMPWTRFLA